MEKNIATNLHKSSVGSLSVCSSKLYHRIIPVAFLLDPLFSYNSVLDDVGQEQCRGLNLPLWFLPPHRPRGRKL